MIISGSGSAAAPCVGGTFTATFDVTASPDGSLFFYASQRDAAQNASAQAALGLVKHTRAPAVTIVSPAHNALINAASSSALTLLGVCSEINQPVVISGDVSATTPCQGGIWNTTLNLAALGEGSVSIHVNHASAEGITAPQANRTLLKDALAPALTFTSPPAGALVSTSNMAELIVTGACSENGAAVTISGAVSGTASCQSGAFSTAVDASALPDGAFTLYARQHDGAGNQSPQVSLTLPKDTTAPTVSFLSPAAGTLVNATQVSAFLVSGHCSESGRDVRLNGDATATVPCTNGFFNALLNLSAASSGNVTVTADHNDSALSPAVTTSRTFVKDTQAPTLAFTSPATLSYVSTENQAALEVTGSCSDSGRAIAISGSALDTVLCTDNVFTATFDFSTLPDGPIFILASYSDAAGNPSAQASLGLVRTRPCPR